MKTNYTLIKKGLKIYGKPAIKKIKDKIILSKKVKDIITNEIYSSVTKAAEKIKIKRTTLSAMLVGQNPNTTNFIYLNN